MNPVKPNQSEMRSNPKIAVAGSLKTTDIVLRQIIF